MKGYFKSSGAQITSVKQKITQVVVKQYNAILLKMDALRVHGVYYGSKLLNAIIDVIITLLVSVSAVLALYFPYSRSILEKYQEIETILTSLGATFGTILALVLTLSVIPVQRAGDAWSPSIVRLYRRDSITHFIFIFLGLLCAASFTLAVKDVSEIGVAYILVGSLVMLGMSLDLLRWYHRHICILLDPAHAVSTVTKYANKAIDQIHSTVRKTAQAQYKNLSSEQKSDINIFDLEALNYPRVRGYPDIINFWINDLGEIANKGTVRGEKFLASTAIIGIRNVIIHYLESRKENLVISASPEAMYLVSESDVKFVTDKAYEVIQEISRSAISIDDESTAIKVSEIYADIAIYSENLVTQRIEKNAAPLSTTPISYLLTCVEYAQKKDLTEVIFQSAGILSRISLQAPEKISIMDVHIPVVDGIQKIAIKLYIKQEYILAENLVGHPMEVLNKLTANREDRFKDLLRHVLELIEGLVPYSIANEALQERLTLQYPLSKVYGGVNSNSLGNLLGKYNQYIEIDEDRPWINPYHEIIDILDIYQRHFRNVGERTEFGNSFLLWELIHLIKDISIVVSQMIERPLREGYGDEQEVVDKLEWIISFMWVAFNKKKIINQRWADDAGDVLAYVGILFFDMGYPEVMRSSVSHIKSIINSYCEISGVPDLYAIGDLYAHLWCMRILAALNDNVAVIGAIDEVLQEKPDVLTDGQWQNAQETIELRRNQLIERMGEIDRRMLRDSAEELLSRILSRREG